MKKFWVIVIITFSMSLTFLTFYLTSNNERSEIDEGFTQKVLDIKMNFVKVFNIVDENKTVFDDFPTNEFPINSPRIADTFNDIVSEVSKSNEKIKALYILSEDNSVISSINSDVMSEYLIRGEGRSLVLDNDKKYLLMYDNDWMILQRNIYDIQGSKIGGLYVLFKDEIFSEFNVERVKDIVVMSSMYVENCDDIINENYKTVKNIAVPLKKVSAVALSEYVFAYKTKLSQNDDIYFIDQIEPEISQTVLFYLVVTSVFVFALSLILLMFNYALMSKKKRLQEYNEKMNREMDF